MQDAIGVEAELIAEGRGIFDVTVDGNLVYSKFETGTFPDEAALTAEIAALTA